MYGEMIEKIKNPLTRLLNVSFILILIYSNCILLSFLATVNLILSNLLHPYTTDDYIKITNNVVKYHSNY